MNFTQKQQLEWTAKEDERAYKKCISASDRI